ncbi:hypothetical protein GCM10010306_083290 [Streptomyces umbrinus]|nr:hypothetical protein GCM10010306_083290 [Streptomyces umbrinus]
MPVLPDYCPRGWSQGVVLPVLSLVRTFVRAFAQAVVRAQGLMAMWCGCAAGAVPAAHPAYGGTPGRPGQLPQQAEAACDGDWTFRPPMDLAATSAVPVS